MPEEYDWDFAPEEVSVVEAMQKDWENWRDLCNELGIPVGNPLWEGISFREYIRREYALKKMREYANTRSQNQSGSQENS